MTPFELMEPASLREAIALLDPDDPTVRPIAGGTALMLMMKAGVFRPRRLVSLRIKIVDVPGALSKVSKIIGDSGANIIEVHHQRLFSDIPLKQTEMDVAVETLDQDHVQALVQELCQAGFETRVLSATSA